VLSQAAVFAASALRAGRIVFETGATEGRSGFEPVKRGRTTVIDSTVTQGAQQ